MTTVIRSSWLATAAIAVLCGCAQMPSEPPPPPSAPAAAPAPPPVSRTVADAVTRHRRAAESARQSGDLATAAVQLQILTVLAPDDATYRRELASVRADIDKAVHDQVAAGQAAISAGDLDRANAAMLRVLALDPAQADAARTLREIDRRRLSRIQADRAAKVSLQDQVAMRGTMRAQAEANDAFDVEQAIEMFRAGDSSGGLRDLKAYVDANQGNRAARQRIGTVVADRAKELEAQGAREQALSLYEQAIVLRGDASAPWAARVPLLKKTLSQEYFDKGTRAYRTNLVQAIALLETSVKYDPANTQASLKLKEAKAAREKLEKIK